MKRFSRVTTFTLLALSLLLVLLRLSPSIAATGISLTAIGTAYTQNFDSLVISGTSSTLPLGWSLSETGTGADANYRAGDGGNNTGDTYSFGVGSDRAFGSLQSSSVISTIGAGFTNNTGQPITSMVVSFTGEQWRLGTVGRADRLDFQYSLDATGLTDGSWMNVDALDFSSPVTTGTTGALDGNNAANRLTVSANITGLNIPNGATFFIRWTDSNASGADDGLAIDDFSLTPKTGDAPPPPPTITAINAIQGSGSASPLVGTVVTTTGIVTGVKSNGFFLQSATPDNDPNTSEGIFVFTSTTPPASASPGNEVQVMGTVIEFRPSADPNSPPVTEIGNAPFVTLLSGNNPLPAAVTLTAADTNPAGSNEQLEKYEGMLVNIDSLTAVSPTGGFFASGGEASATATSNGMFFAVITGIARPFREPGVEVPTTLPATIPRFDGNPERLRVDTDMLVGAAALEVTSGVILTNVKGILDYGSRTYTILPLPGNQTQANVSGNLSAVAVPVASANEFTVASANLERFFDTTDDPGVNEVVLTSEAFSRRLQKASLVVRNVLQMPDIIGVEEMENLTTLQSVANKINADAVATGQGDPKYAAYLEEGNDPGGIDVGFLVKTSRVKVLSVTQEGKDAGFVNPSTNLTETLNDRPPLVLRATVNSADGVSFPLTVIVNHLRSLLGLEDAAGGARVREKRRAQAEYLARLIQARQQANPNERIISVGDYNAYQFNDGFVDILGTIKGTPTPLEQVLTASADLVNPDLTDLIELVPAEQRYSYSFNGNAQTIDHELVNAPLMNFFSRMAFARCNADFPESYRNDGNRPERISDHDAAVAYFNFTSRTDRTRRDGKRDVPSRVIKPR
ncbi:MAG: hypothetical protein JST84_00655 [Acidobacteria bacterium]|nr:hypothetical protein [Acidobacteriota bacterium]